MPEIAKLYATVGADTRDAEKGFARVSQKISGFAVASGVALAAAGAAVGAAGFAAVKSAASFEQTMSGVKAVSGATNDELKGLSKLALQLGKDTSFGASEAAAGIEELVKGGLTIEDIMGGAAKSTLDLAAAGGIAIPEAAIIAANAMAQFGLKGKDMAHVANLIAGAANASALDVGQFKMSLAAAGAVASTVGFSFDDLAQGIAVMGKAGIVGSDAGTSLKTMMLNLSPQTKKAKELMRELGIVTADGANAFFDATGKVKSMAEVSQVLQNATRHLTDEQKLATLAQLFGTDAVRAAAVMAKEGASGFSEMAGAMGKVTAASVGAERLNNLNGSLEQLKGSLETAAIVVGTAFLPMLRGAADAATGLVNAAMPWIEASAPKIIAGFETAAAVARNLAGSLAGVLLEAFEVVSGVVGVVNNAFTSLRETLGGVFTYVAAVVRGDGLALHGLLMRLPEPIRGVGEAFKYVWDLAQGFWRAVTGAAEIVLGLENFDNLQLGLEAMTEAFRNLTGIDLSAWIGTAMDIVFAFKDGLDTLAVAFAGLVGTVRAGGLAGLWTEIQRVMEPFAPTADRIERAIGALAGGLDTLLTALGRLVPDPLESFITGLLGSAQAAAAGVQPLDTLAAVVNTVSGALEGAVGFLRENHLAQSALVGVIGAAATAWVLHTAAVIAHNTWTKAVTFATQAYTAAQWLLNAALTANPIGIVVVALAGLAAALIYAYNTSETFRATVDRVFAGVTSAVQTMWSVVGPILDVFWQTIGRVADALAGLLLAISGMPASVPAPRIEQPVIPTPNYGADNRWAPPVNTGTSGPQPVITIGGVTRDQGGWVNAGQMVGIGTGAQPELFVPSTPGRMFPAGSYGMGGQVTVPVDVRIGDEVIYRTIARVNTANAERGVRQWSR